MIYTIKELPVLLVRELGEDGDIGQALIIGCIGGALLWLAIFAAAVAVQSC